MNRIRLALIGELDTLNKLAGVKQQMYFKRERDRNYVNLTCCRKWSEQRIVLKHADSAH